MTEAATETTKEIKPQESKKAEKETSSVENLTDKDIKWRAKYKSTREELEDVKVKAEKESRELSSKFESSAKEKSVIEQRWVEAELKAEATAAGLTDMEFTKLIDTSGVKVNGDKIEGIKEAIEAFKTRKPNLFGAEKKLNSSNGIEQPSQEGTSIQFSDAWGLTEKEFKNSITKLTSSSRWARTK